jgi:hypothetical protein
MALTSSIPGMPFDTSKPFYPLVMNYLALLFGLTELEGLGLINEFGELSASSPKLDWDAVVEGLLEVVTKSGVEMEPVKQRLIHILGPVDLRSECLDVNICVKRGDVMHDVMMNPMSPLDALMRSAGGILLILAYQKCPKGSWADPLWQFLRHCRNAAAHDCRFNIELRKDGTLLPAVWHGFRLHVLSCGKPLINGMALFKDGTGTGLLSPGDPLRLLWDIEQACPNMRA